MSLVAAYTPTEMFEADKKDAKLDSILDQCLCWDTLIVLRDLIAGLGTERAGYKLIV